MSFQSRKCSSLGNKLQGIQVCALSLDNSTSSDPVFPSRAPEPSCSKLQALGPAPWTEAVELASTAELWFFSRRGSRGCGPGPLALKKLLLLLLQLGATLSSPAHSICGRLPESQPGSPAQSGRHGVHRALGSHPGRGLWVGRTGL